MPLNNKPNAIKRRPPLDAKSGKFNDKMSMKSKSAGDTMAARDVDTFDRGGLSGRPHTEFEGVDPVHIISRYSDLGKSLKKSESFSKVAQQIAKIAEMAETTVMKEAGDWFDEHTIKRNMKELKGYAGQFSKIAEELDTMQQRATALYDDMGNVLTRYFEIAEAQEDPENPEPGDEPEETEFDDAAVDMGNQSQQGWTEDADPDDEYDDAKGGAVMKEDEDWDSESEIDPEKDDPDTFVPSKLKSTNGIPEADYDLPRGNTPADQGIRAAKLDALASKLGVEWQKGDTRDSFEDRVRQAARVRKEGGPGSGPQKGNYSNDTGSKEASWAYGNPDEPILPPVGKPVKKEGRGLALPGSQSYKDNFKTKGIEGEAIKGGGITCPKCGGKKAPGGILCPSCATKALGKKESVLTREDRLIVAKEFAHHPKALNRVVNTLKRQEIKELLKSKKVRNIREARRHIAMEAINRFARRAKMIAERGPTIREDANPNQKMADIKKIVDTKSMGKVEGQKLDLFSAGAIMAVYEALSPENKQKFAAMPVAKMATVAFRLVK